MSGKETLLSVAATFPGEFSLESLVVQAWKSNPERFWMKQYKYPDTNKVKSELCGKLGLVGKGLLRKTNQNEYELTSLGKALLAKRFAHLSPPEQVEEADPTLPTDEEVEHWKKGLVRLSSHLYAVRCKVTTKQAEAKLNSVWPR